MRKLFPELLLCILLCTGISCAWLFNTNPNSPGDKPTPIPTEVVNTPVPKPTDFPPLGEIQETIFRNVTVGKYHDYAIAENGTGYLLALVGRAFYVSKFVGDSISEPELAYSNGPNHRLQFNKPRIVTFNNEPYIFWGPHSGRGTGIEYVKKEEGVWLQPKMLLSHRNFEFFDVESFDDKLYVLAFALPDDGTQHGDMLFFDMDGNIVLNSKFDAKNINSYKADGVTFFSSRFRNNFLWKVVEHRISKEKYQREFHEPILELVPNSKRDMWIHGYKFDGELPKYLAVDDGDNTNLLAELNNEEAHNTSLLTASIHLGNKVFLFYDILNSIYSGELNYDSNGNVVMRNNERKWSGFYPVSQSYNNTRAELVFRNNNDLSDRFGTLVSFEYR